ncbi:MAG TPA: response regulator transcription factor [Symbiobacteriaceae bacterium]|nr:response regulator transcription factor [Symbiobacteriaceae bacterium]
MDTIRLLLVEDQTIVRQGLRRLLETEETLQVAGEADSVDSAVQQAAEVEPDVILMDLKLGSESGLEAIRRILALDPGAKIIALTMYDEYPMVQEAVAAGVLGYSPKLTTLGQLLDAIHTVRKGERYIHPSLLPTLMDGIRQQALQRAAGKAVICEEDRRLLRLLAEGLSFPDIASRTFVSERTVRRHAQALLDRLEVSNTAQAVALAIRQGWL